MPCRVGITTDPEERKRHWKRRVHGLRNWKQDFIGRKSEAQAIEDSRIRNCNLSRNRGKCHGNHGGGDPYNPNWYVYEFDYDRMKKMVSS